MPAVSLYRKWRPQTFTDIIGQEHITTTLMNAIRANRIAHAYLFTGPRGTGKTTTARIFAKAVSCLAEDESRRPCNECEICLSVNSGRDLDLIEIDGASNNKVEDVRELRDRVGFSPNQSRYRVYIIDEVHMLSASAFNALLKTLEEPPPHVIFILATTEVDKLPATILSRCQRFDFRFMPFRLLRDQLAMIAEAEGARIEPGALDLFARQAGGSMRDGISLLDQMIAYGDGVVSLKQAQAILGSIAAQAVAQLTGYMVARDVAGGLGLINQAIADGADPRQFVREVLEYLRGLLLLRGSPDGTLLSLPAETIAEMKVQASALPTAELLVIIRSFTQAVQQLRDAPQPQLPIEIAFVESALRLDPADGSRPDASSVRPETQRVAPAAGKPMPNAAAPVAAAPATARESRPAPGPTPIPRADAAVESMGVPRTTQGTLPAGQAATGDGASKTVSTRNPAPATSGTGTPDAPPQAATKSAGGARTGTSQVPRPETASPPNAPAGSEPMEILQDRWKDVLAAIKAQNRSLEAILKAGNPTALTNGVVVLGFPYDFHKSKVEEPKSKQFLEEVLSTTLSMPLKIRCEIVKADAKRSQIRPKDKNQVAMEDPLVREIVNKYNARIAGVEA